MLLACAIAVSPNLADADLWGHVLYGSDTLSGGISPTATYSFTASGYSWINHENLSEIVLAIVANVGGGMGLMTMKCLLGLVVIGLVLHAGRKSNVSRMIRCIVSLLVSVNLAYHWSVRPQIFSYTLFAVLIGLVSYSFSGWEGSWQLPWFRRLARAHPGDFPKYNSGRMRCLWWAVPLMSVWANTHGGFVAGFCIYTVLLLCRSVEALCRWGHQAWGLVRRFALMILAAGLATLVNPYGPGLHWWLFNSLGQPRPEIAEWHPPELFSWLTLPLLVIASIWLLTLVFSRRQLDFSQLVILSFTLWQCFLHQRHVPFFAILFGYWVSPHVESLWRRLHKTKVEVSLDSEMKPAIRRVVITALCFGILLLVGQLAGRLKSLNVKRDVYPVAALQYMHDMNLHGNLVVTYNWAQYAIAAFGSDQRMRVGFDGRFRTCYPQSIVDMHFDFILGNGSREHRWRGLESPPFQADRVLRFRDPDLVLVNRQQAHSLEILKRHRTDWALLYQDQLAQLWGRSNQFDNSCHANFLPEQRRNITDAIQTGFVSWPALPTRIQHVQAIAELPIDIDTSNGS